ncbi:hypothetical protein [Bradyrhizobium tunisiense]|uniref:hypothetical protein n=1 Tax=Bradyrhizobium tunisiense TaxID=3278709 RepID=UPI0035DE04C3
MIEIAFPTIELIVDTIIQRSPSSIRISLDFSMHFAGGLIATFHAVDEAYREHGIDLEKISGTAARARANYVEVGRNRLGWPRQARTTHEIAQNDPLATAFNQLPLRHTPRIWLTGCRISIPGSVLPPTCSERRNSMRNPLLDRLARHFQHPRLSVLQPAADGL